MISEASEGSEAVLYNFSKTALIEYFVKSPSLASLPSLSALLTAFPLCATIVHICLKGGIEPMNIVWGGYMNRESFVCGFRLSVCVNGGWHIDVIHKYTLIGETKRYDDPYCKEATDEAICIITRHLQRRLECAKNEISECEKVLMDIENERAKEALKHE